MVYSLKDELVACLKLFDSPELKKKLSPAIAELQQAVKPIQDDEKLTAFLLRLLPEVPDAMKDPKSARLKAFLLKLKHEPMRHTYRNGKR